MRNSSQTFSTVYEKKQIELRMLAAYAENPRALYGAMTKDFHDIAYFRENKRKYYEQFLNTFMEKVDRFERELNEWIEKEASWWAEDEDDEDPILQYPTQADIKAENKYECEQLKRWLLAKKFIDRFYDFPRENTEKEAQEHSR